jgi:predicted anti-sigma-YlaC factor YlaD
MENYSQATEPGHLSEDMLNEYLDGYLLPEVNITVEKHLAKCPVCAERYEQLQALFLDFEAVPDIPLQRDLSRQIEDAIHSKPQIPAFVKWSMLPQLAIAAFILLTFLPRYMQGRLALLPNAVNLSVDLGVLRWFANVKEWFGSMQFSLPAWTSSSLNFKFQLQALDHINWLLFVLVMALLLIANGYLLRQVSRNGSH